MSLAGRIVNVFRARRIEADLDDELAFHIAERVDELVAQGMSREKARREARRRFGSYIRQREETRDMDVVRLLESFLKDLRYGARQLRLNPGFAAVAVLSLALGIGANSAIFQLINALRLRSLSLPHAEQLVSIEDQGRFMRSGWTSGRHDLYTYAQFELMAEHQEAFQDLLAFATDRFNLSRGGEARYAQGLYVTPNFFQVAGVSPMLGAWMSPDTDAHDCAGAGVMLDYAFWQRNYGGDPAIVGRDISLNGRNFPVLGVTPPSFGGLEPARRYDLAVPLCADRLLDEDGEGRLVNKTAWWLVPIGRLKPDWSLERASAHVSNLSELVFRESVPESYQTATAERYMENKLQAVAAHAGVSEVRREMETPLWILLASTGLVLLIACANLANLLLARASVRGREVALRQAVGASRRRLIGQMLAESLLLAGCGAALGGVFAYGLSRALIVFISDNGYPVEMGLGLDWRVVGFTAGLALLTCFLFGLVPALRATRGAPADAMRGGRGAAAGGERHGLRRTLVVAQIALSFVLLVGALLFGQSLRNLLGTDTGIRSEGVLVAAVDTRTSALAPENRLDVYRRLQDRFGALPEVTSAAAVLMTPFGGSGWNESCHADDDPDLTDGTNVWFNRVGPGYFETMETPLFSGRDLSDRDVAGGPQVAVVNQELARRLFGDPDPAAPSVIGRSFRNEPRKGEEPEVYQIVGLVKDTKYGGLREEQRAIAFLPVAQDGQSPIDMEYVLRARGSFASTMEGVKRQIAEVDPGLQVEFRILEREVAESVLLERLMANLSGGFGILAALLSALGLYGVMSYMVARKRSEIGVRMALGAQARDVLRLVLSEAGRLVLVGLLVGLTGAFALSRYAESLLYNLDANNATTLALGIVLLSTVGLIAVAAPVRRASRLSPAVVLRNE